MSDALEIRRHEDGTIDEIVAENCSIHVEQMDAHSWFLGVEDRDGNYWQFWFGSKNRKSPVVFHGHEMTPAAWRPLTLKLEPRHDGGLRVSSPEVPGLILSHSSPGKVLADVWPALQSLIAQASKEKP